MRRTKRLVSLAAVLALALPVLAEEAAQPPEEATQVVEETPTEEPGTEATPTPEPTAVPEPTAPAQAPAAEATPTATPEAPAEAQEPAQPATEEAEPAATEEATEEPQTPEASEPSGAAEEAVVPEASEVPQEPSPDEAGEVVQPDAGQTAEPETPQEPAPEEGVVPEATVAAAEPSPTEQAEADGTPAEETADAPQTSLALTLTDPADLAPVDGVYAVDPSAVTSLTLEWQCTGACDRVDARIENADGAVLYAVQGVPSPFALPLTGLAEGSYTAILTAVSGDSAVAEVRFGIAILPAAAEQQPDEAPEGEERELDDEKPDEEKPDGERPDGEKPDEDRQGGGSRGGAPSGSRSGGSRSGGSGSQEQSEAQQGFRVTPGEALTTAHSAGTRDMTPYGAAALTLPEEPMNRLTLGDEALDIARADGGDFTGSVNNSLLSLSAIGDCDAWTLNGYALKTLALSGIDALELVSGNDSVALPTTLSLRGDAYARLCAEGYVSRDYEYTVSADGIFVAIAGGNYRLEADGTLAATEGK